MTNKEITYERLLTRARKLGFDLGTRPELGPGEYQTRKISDGSLGEDGTLIEISAWFDRWASF